MAEYLHNARIVDGTGSPAYDGYLIIDGGRIRELGPGELTGDFDTSIDLGGACLTPGFIDIHTHYDAQVFWEPLLQPSANYGVTTAVIGNCGFSVAPLQGGISRTMMLETLAAVEDMPIAAIEQAVPDRPLDFADYLNLLDQTPLGVNVAALIGHTALRIAVMGTDAVEREATDAELDRMRRELKTALDAGAIGLATSRSSSHRGYRGQPVASRVASVQEVDALLGELAKPGDRVFQVAIGNEFDELAHYAERFGGNLSWSALLTGRYEGGAEGVLERTKAMGSHLFAQVSCRPLTIEASLAKPSLFANTPSFAELVAAPTDQLERTYRDASWRAAARGDLDARWGHRWASAFVLSSPTSPDVEGMSLVELAQRDGSTPFDAMIELALADQLQTRFSFALMNDDEDELGRLLLDESTILGLSDAGAHLAQLCDACFALDLLGRWSRDLGVLSLERAVWRLTGQPAAVFGIPERGVLTPGNVADLVVFDPATVGAGRRERLFDVPGGGERLNVRPEGIRHVWLGGKQVLRSGERLDDSLHGRVIRPRSVNTGAGVGRA